MGPSPVITTSNLLWNSVKLASGLHTAKCAPDWSVTTALNGNDVSLQETPHREPWGYISQLWAQNHNIESARARENRFANATLTAVTDAGTCATTSASLMLSPSSNTCFLSRLSQNSKDKSLPVRPLPISTPSPTLPPFLTRAPRTYVCTGGTYPRMWRMGLMGREAVLRSFPHQHFGCMLLVGSVSYSPGDEELVEEFFCV